MQDTSSASKSIVEGLNKKGRDEFITFETQ